MSRKWQPLETDEGDGGSRNNGQQRRCCCCEIMCTCANSCSRTIGYFVALAITIAVIIVLVLYVLIPWIKSLFHNL